MKKTTVLLGAVALVGAAYVGSTWYVGKQAELAITDAVAQANERVARNLLGVDPVSARFNIEIRSYQRGLFSSEAHYVFHTTDADGEPLEYILQDHLQHGPFPIDALREGQLAPMLAYSQARMLVTPFVEQWFDPQQGATPLSVQTRVGFGGKGSSRWTFYPFETSRADQRASFSGGYLQVDFSDGFSNNVVNGHFDVYALTDNTLDEKVEVRDVSLQAATQWSAQGHFDQDSTFRIREMALSAADDASTIVIDDLTIQLASQQQAGSLDGQLRYDAARVLADGSDLGELSAALAVSGLDVDALSDLQATYAALAAQHGADTVAGFMLSAQEQRLLQEKLRPVLRAGPAIALESAHWKNAAGKSTASASLALADPGELVNTDVIMMLQDLIANAKLDLAVERAMVVGLFGQVGAADDIDAAQAAEMGGMLFDEYADLLTEMGLARLDNNALTLSLDASPADDTVIFNGETLTLDQFKMRLMWLLFLPFS